MRRYEIESFYYTDASKELIKQDKDGKQRVEIREYENYVSADSVLMAKDQIEVNTHHMHITDRKTLLARKQFFRDVLTLAGLADANSAVITERCIHASDLTACVEYLANNKTKIQRWFDIDLRKDMKEKPVQQLGVFLKLMGITWKKKSKKTPSGGKEYYYWIPQERIDALNAIVSRRTDSPVTENWHTERKATTENRLFTDFHDVEYQIKEQIRNPDVDENAELVAGLPDEAWEPSQLNDEFTA